MFRLINQQTEIDDSGFYSIIYAKWLGLPQSDGPLFFYWGSLFGKKLSAYDKCKEKELSAEKILQKNCLHNTGKVGKPFLLRSA